MQFALFLAQKPLCLPVRSAVVQSVAHRYLPPPEPSILVLIKKKTQAVGSRHLIPCQPQHLQGEEAQAYTGGLWTCIGRGHPAVLLFSAPEFGPGNFGTPFPQCLLNFSVISQSRKCIFFSDDLVHKRTPWLQRGIGANCLKRFKAWSNPVVGHYGVGCQAGWVRRYNKHVFKSSLFPSVSNLLRPKLFYHIFAIYFCR